MKTKISNERTLYTILGKYRSRLQLGYYVKRNEKIDSIINELVKELKEYKKTLA